MEDEEFCKKCGSTKFWEDCYNCEDGYSHHECGEDSCCCLDPYNNVKCDICKGEEGWYRCTVCAPLHEGETL